jgi:hypothetical protein
MIDQAKAAQTLQRPLTSRAAKGEPYIRVELIPIIAAPLRQIGEINLANPAVKYARQDCRPTTHKNVVSTSG